MSQLRVNGPRLQADLERLAQIGRAPGGGINRTAYSAADAEARQWYQDCCDAAGLAVSLDGLGNTFAQLPHPAPTLPAVWTGSHIDTVPDGGPLDGALGTVAALECVRRLAESRIELARPVRSVILSDEEGNYSGRLLGSYGLSHGYDHDELAAMTGRGGDLLLDTLGSWSWSSGSPTQIKLAPGVVHSFVELHIEQGPNLAAEGIDIGVVTSIVGLCGARVEFLGRADHAGTTPMGMRRDALRAASDFVTQLPGIAASVADTAVATCGRLNVEPGGANVVPGRVELSVDFRDQSLSNIEAMRSLLHQAATDAGRRHDIEVVWTPQPVVHPVPMTDEIRSVIADSADELGYSRRDLLSGAGHDSQNMARLAPTGMIFVPSRDGRSHSPAEYTDFAAIERGANVLLVTLLRLASR
ncbi:MAG: Zn-dependent hydrolase [Geodermatophilaceae bacterium]